MKATLNNLYYENWRWSRVTLAEGEGLRKLQQHHYKLWEDRWKLEENRWDGVHVLSRLIWCGRSAKFSVTGWRELNFRLAKGVLGQRGRTSTPREWEVIDGTSDWPSSSWRLTTSVDILPRAAEASQASECIEKNINIKYFFYTLCSGISQLASGFHNTYLKLLPYWYPWWQQFRTNLCFSLWLMGQVYIYMNRYL